MKKYDLTPAYTGNGFQNDLIATGNKYIKTAVEAMTDVGKEMEKTTNQLKDVSKAVGKTTNKIDSLEVTVKRINKSNSKMQWAILILTTITVILAALQVFKLN